MTLATAASRSAHHDFNGDGVDDLLFRSLSGTFATWTMSHTGTIVGGVILTPFMGLYGVLIALIASNVYRTIDLLLFTPKYVTHLSVWGSLARLLRVFLASAAVYVPLYFFDYQPVGFISLVIYAFCVSLFAAAVVLISGVIFEREEMKDVVLRLRGVVQRKR